MQYVRNPAYLFAKLGSILFFIVFIDSLWYTFFLIHIF